MSNVSRMLLWRFLQIRLISNCNLCTVWLCILQRLPPLVLSWNMDHGSLSTLCLPWRDRMLCKGNTQWQVLHTEIHTDKWFSKKDESLLLWNLGVNLALCQTGTSISPAIICKGSFHGIRKISLFLSFPLKKVSVTQTSQSSQLDARVGCPVTSPLS